MPEVSQKSPAQTIDASPAPKTPIEAPKAVETKPTPPCAQASPRSLDFGPEDEASEGGPHKKARVDEGNTSAIDGHAYLGTCLLLEPEPPVLGEEPSAGAIYKRIYRLMRPRADGSFVLPESIRNEWKDKTTRPNVDRIFERCGYNVGH